MGMSKGEVLRKVQLPVARPLILNGIRLASAAVIATATLAALIGGGGLGRFIKDGFAVRNFAKVTAGTLLVMALVVLSEAVFALLIRFTVSPGLRRTRRARRRPEGAAAGA
jgi:osmoprotectant transport system permease protein